MAILAHEFEPYQWDKTRCGFAVDNTSEMCGYPKEQHITKTRPDNKKATVRLPYNMLDKMIGLPEGLIVSAIERDFFSDSLILRIIGDSLPDVCEHTPGTIPYEFRIEWEWDEENQKMRAIMPDYTKET